VFPRRWDEIERSRITRRLREKKRLKIRVWYRPTDRMHVRGTGRARVLTGFGAKSISEVIISSSKKDLERWGLEIAGSWGRAG